MTQTQSSTDHRLKTAINDELGWTPSVNCDGVVAADGAVTLSGHVTSYPEKLAAISAALRVRGVSAVADEIVVPVWGRNRGSSRLRFFARAGSNEGSIWWAT